MFLKSKEKSSQDACLGPASIYMQVTALVTTFAHMHNMQVESALATQNLKPTIDAIKRLYGDDKDKVQRETSALYKKSGVSPTAGVRLLLVACHTFVLTLACFPVWVCPQDWICAWNHQVDRQESFGSAWSHG